MSKKRRLTIALATGALVAAMVPGVVSATPGNDVENYGMCHKNGNLSGGWRQNGQGPLAVNQDHTAPDDLHGPSFSNGNAPLAGATQACP